jgi:hypothetical protein
MGECMCLYVCAYVSVFVCTHVCVCVCVCACVFSPWDQKEKNPPDQLNTEAQKHGMCTTLSFRTLS